MIRAFKYFCLIAGLIFATQTFASGSPTVTEDPKTDTGGVGGGTCDYEALKESLNCTEGGGTKTCSYQGAGYSKTYGYARGKYQFIADTWNRMVKGCPGAAQCPHATMATEACCPAQECAMNNLIASNQNYLSTSKCSGRQCGEAQACERLLGTTVRTMNPGKRWGCGKVTPASCTVTASGLLAAMHLGGNDVCSGILANGHGDHDGGGKAGTYEVDYVCLHGGIAVSGDCTPTSGPGDPNQATPVGTQQQIEIREGQGEEVVVGSDNGLIENWVSGLMLMAEQLTANMIQQMQALGILLDAKHQLETQRIFQEKMAEAHKDYQPSEQMCTYGTFSRALATTERSANLTRSTVSTQLMQREISAGDSMAKATISDSLSRIANFRQYFCEPTDNSNGLSLLCPTPPPLEMRNRDINYTMTMDQPLTLDVNLADERTTNDERAIFALVDNLFVHNPAPNVASGALNEPKFQYHYMNLRSIVAMRGIARNSIANVIALKTATPSETAGEGEDSNGPYIRALFREFGIEDEEIRTLIGDNPSYYAQMEMLTKKIYQNPMFYTNLYDKPANVKRIRAAMTAIKLMQDRDIAAALQRREMLLSMMLELRLREQANDVYSATEQTLFGEQ